MRDPRPVALAERLRIQLALRIYFEDKVVWEIAIESGIGDDYGSATEHRFDSRCRAAFKYRPAQAANYVSGFNFCSKNLIRDLAGNLQALEGYSLGNGHEPSTFLIGN